MSSAAPRPPGSAKIYGKRFVKKSRPEIVGLIAVESQRGSVSAKDIALEDFSARVMELVRLTRNKSAFRFAKTTVPNEDIGHLAKFFTDLTKITGITQQSAEVSTDQRTADHAVLGFQGVP